LTLRSDHKLSDNNFILCCFNSSYKITPKELVIWAKILKNNQNCILWLLDSNSDFKKNIRNFFIKQDININRLEFAKRLPHSNHLERLRHADLFLDTFNYNAHTTCSDALWSGLPVVTKIGDQFSARVAASLLKAIKMDELITTSNTEYEDIIQELIRNKDKFFLLKEKLKRNIKTTPLFNTDKYTSNFEKAMTCIYKKKYKGEENSHIEIKDA
ncbi:hypothetical protein N9441_03775, partial [Candidatus Pelagibacter sp.]|nr:hypothetical protein [Candidatus Pelagibacter sp.]